MLLALGAWVAIGAWGLALGGLPGSALLGVAFFVVFFLGFAAYYWRMAYLVDETGVTVRGPTDRATSRGTRSSPCAAPTCPSAGGR